MKTLLVLASIWVLYSMYRVIKSGNYYHVSDITFVGATIGFIGLFLGLIYLIITYLP